MPAPGSRIEPVPGTIEFRAFESRSAASTMAAGLLASPLRSKLSSDPLAQATLVVSGGTTPGLCFDRLSGEVMDWSRVTVVPSDERWVTADSPHSNEHLIRTRLLQGAASQGKVLSFFRALINAKQASALIAQDLQALSRPFSASLLGMGEDGHFASLFPDYEDLQSALDPRGRALCIAVQTAGSPYMRISLTLSSLLDSALIVLLVFGEAKRRVFEAANTGGSPYPIESLLRHAGVPITVVWAP